MFAQVLVSVCNQISLCVMRSINFCTNEYHHNFRMLDIDFACRPHDDAGPLISLKQRATGPTSQQPMTTVPFRFEDKYLETLSSLFRKILDVIGVGWNLSCFWEDLANGLWISLSSFLRPILLLKTFVLSFGHFTQDNQENSCYYTENNV